LRREVHFSSALFWLEQYHVDGLRVDGVASMLCLDYARKPGEWIPNQYGGRENLEAMDSLRCLKETIYREHPDVQTIAEESTAWSQVSRPTYTGGLGFGLKWDMGWMHDTLRYMKRNSAFRKHHHVAGGFELHARAAAQLSRRRAPGRLLERSVKQHRPVNLVVQRQIRPDAQHIPVPRCVLHLPFLRADRADRFGDELLQPGKGQVVPDVAQGPPGVTGQQVENLFRRRADARDGRRFLFRRLFLHGKTGPSSRHFARFRSPDLQTASTNPCLATANEWSRLCFEEVHALSVAEKQFSLRRAASNGRVLLV
jgi:hypothetical protein